jgi:hypothetical protein
VGEPEIQRSDGDQRSAERDAIVKHEVDDAALVEPAQIARGHAEVFNIMGQKAPRALWKIAKPPHRFSTMPSDEREQRPAIDNNGAE